MTKPTPTPWTIHPDGEIISERTNHNNLNPVAVHSGACTPADATLIVECVNSHDAMREALEELLQIETATCQRLEHFGMTGVRERFSRARMVLKG